MTGRLRRRGSGGRRPGPASGARAATMNGSRGAASSRPSDRDDEVEGPLRHPRVRLLPEMEHAHEPGRRQVVQRHAPEGVLEELRDADDPEAGRREIEQWIDRPGAHLARRSGSRCRAAGRDDLRELLEGAQRRDSLGVAAATLADEAEHRERSRDGRSSAPRAPPRRSPPCRPRARGAWRCCARRAPRPPRGRTRRSRPPPDAPPRARGSTPRSRGRRSRRGL